MFNLTVYVNLDCEIDMVLVGNHAMITKSHLNAYRVPG